MGKCFDAVFSHGSAIKTSTRQRARAAACSARRMAHFNIFFVSGTDTGVGKTVVTALLLHHLRLHGRHALALKPFCSGSRRDVQLLQAIQKGELPDDRVCPFFFPQPVAPYADLMRTPRNVTLARVCRHIGEIARTVEILLVEGVGGLLVPLGKTYTVIDLIQSLGCPVILVTRNKLGTINHTLLSVEALKARGISDLRIVLMDQKTPDSSSGSNRVVFETFLEKMGAAAPVFSLPFLGQNPARPKALDGHQKKLEKTLARILRTH
jgi:dethiobiotin synthetase